MHNIARNSLMLYIRMLLSMVVGFYTSRVVLQTLGVVDYGIYNLVGGIVAMFSFINTSMSSATSRFIAFDLGLGDFKQLQTTFNVAFQAHLIIALIIVVLAETVGLWYLHTQLIIPVDRQSVAFWVYQLSVFSTFLSITQAPYVGVVIAHERMDIYAWLEILNVILKLLAVWLIQVVTYDSLLAYSIFSLFVSLIIILSYRYFCIVQYQESHIHFVWQPKTLRSMLSFGSWTLFSEGSDSLRLQANSLFLNRFFGLAINAASSLAIMVQGAFWALGGYTLTAFNPQIVKSYACGDICRMQRLMTNALTVILVIMSMLTVPVFFYLPLLLDCWLVEVPPYTVSICRVLLIDNLFGLVNRIIVLGVSAQGKICTISLLWGISKLICIPFSYFLIISLYEVQWIYAFNILMVLCCLCINLFILKRQIPSFKLQTFCVRCLKTILIVTISILSYYLLYRLYASSISSHIISLFLFYLLLLSSTFFILLDRFHRDFVMRKISCLCK